MSKKEDKEREKIENDRLERDVIVTYIVFILLFLAMLLFLKMIGFVP